LFNQAGVDVAIGWSHAQAKRLQVRKKRLGIRDRHEPDARDFIVVAKSSARYRGGKGGPPTSDAIVDSITPHDCTHRFDQDSHIASGDFR
jgi:hypothetical protein